MFDVLEGLLILIAMFSVWAILGPIRGGLCALRRSELWQFLGVCTLGVLTRVWLSPANMAPVPDVLATRLVLTHEFQSPHPVYGGGVQALGRGWQSMTDSGITGWVDLQFGMACLVPPLIWFITRMCVEPEQKVLAGLFGGVLAAILPVHILFSASVLEHVLLTTVCAASLAAGLASRVHQNGLLGLLSGLLAGFAAHIRPETLPFVAVVGLGLFLGPRRGRILRMLGGCSAIGFGILRAIDIDSATMGIGRRILFRIADRFTTIEVLEMIFTWSWSLRPQQPLVYDAFLSPASTPAIAWPLAVLGFTLLIRRRQWALPLAWLALFLPICLRGSPLSDALRLQMPSMLMACSLFGVACAVVLCRRALWQSISVLFGLVLLAAPLLKQNAQPWLASSMLPVMKQGLSILPASASIVVPRFNHYATFESSLIDALRPHQSSKTLTLDKNTPLPSGEVWLWWPILCNEGVLDGVGMRPGDLAHCARFDGCSLNPVNEAYLQGRVDTGWHVPPEGIRVGWYTIQGCS